MKRKIYHYSSFFFSIPLRKTSDYDAGEEDEVICCVKLFLRTPPPPRWPSGKASASRAEDPGFESRMRRDFFGVESYQ